MKIKILYDNSKCDLRLEEGFGFSCLIDWEEKQILFDTGADDKAFFSNAKLMDVDLGSVTHAVFSHKHSDHRAGYAEVVNRLQKTAPVYVPYTFPSSLLEEAPATVLRAGSFTMFAKNCYLLVLKIGFDLYEQSLVLDGPKGLVIVTGCAHAGILKILDEAEKKLPRPIHCVVGGFHLLRSFKRTRVRIIEQFQAKGVEKVAPCHCAGSKAIAQFEEAYGEGFIKVGTGSAILL